MIVRANSLGTRKLINGVRTPARTAYIYGNKTLENETLLKYSYSGCVYKFPVGWNEESYPIKLNDIKLNRFRWR